MDYLEMSTKLVDILKLNGKPIAVSLLTRNEDVPEGMEKVDKPVRYCQMLQNARFNDAITLAAEAEHSCKGGAAAVGLADYPDNIKTGALYYNKLGKEISLGIAKRVVDNMPRPTPGSIVATIVAPLDNSPTKPDVIIIMGDVLTARRIVHAVIYRHGGRMTSNFAGIQSTCADATGSPYTTGEVNISIGCDGAAKNAGLKDDEMVIGIPAELMEDIVNILDAKAQAWDDWMRT
jgi:uncharacterized protein (DUF169 family)